MIAATRGVCARARLQIKTHDQHGLAHSVPFSAPQRPLRAWWEHIDEGLAGHHSTAGARILNGSGTVFGGLTHRLFSSRRLLPVCFGGSFAAARSSIARLPREVWRKLAGALARGDNIEESHYMERLWAALLTDLPAVDAAAAAPHNMEERLLKAARAIVGSTSGDYWMRGSLDGCTCVRATDSASSTHHLSQT
jgi:hypothetical protein